MSFLRAESTYLVPTNRIFPDESNAIESEPNPIYVEFPLLKLRSTLPSSWNR